MGQLAITINGRSYQIACEDGQEKHTAELAAYIDKRVKDLAASVGQVGDMRLLVLASLLVADELREVYDELDSARAEVGAQTGKEPNGGDSAAEELAAQSEAVLAERLEAAAGALEDIAVRLERV